MTIEDQYEPGCWLSSKYQLPGIGELVIWDFGHTKAIGQLAIIGHVLAIYIDGTALSSMPFPEMWRAAKKKK